MERRYIFFRRGESREEQDKIEIRRIAHRQALVQWRDDGTAAKCSPSHCLAYLLILCEKRNTFNYNFDLGTQTIPEANYLWADKMMTSHIKISYDCESERNFLDKTLKLQAG